ncbi:sugar transferase [Muricoccus radiodurans]|uniref:sugar transferase n=1 Tax=Muricoccus radiodurans TaxID=2231721 RepID=UPI003CEBC812
MSQDAAAARHPMPIGPGPGLSSPAPSSSHNSTLMAAAMQTTDRILALAMLVLTLPLLLLAASAVRLSSPGPALLCIPHLGCDGTVFPLWTLRTTRMGSAPSTAEVTKLGHVLRIVRIDQLPVLLSVLRGDMALLGPCPERALSPLARGETDQRHHHPRGVRPGASGWVRMN